MNIKKETVKEEAILFAKLDNDKSEIAIITHDKYLNPVAVKLKNRDSLVLNINSTNIIKIFSPVRSFPIEPGDRIEIIIKNDKSLILNDLNNNEKRQQKLNVFNDYDNWYQSKYNSDIKKLREKAFDIPFKNIDSIKQNNKKFYYGSKIKFIEEYEQKGTLLKKDTKEYFLSFYHIYNLFGDFQNIVKVFPDNNEEKHKAWKEIADYTNTNTNIVTLNILSNATNILFNINQNDGSLDEIIEKLNSSLNPDIRDLLLYKLLLSVNDAPTFKNYLDKFNSTSTNNTFKKLLKEKYENLQLVENSPKTLMQTANGTNVSIEDIISQNYGKYILINFWASWCSPCIKELKVLIPESKKLDSNDIVFIYISVDTEKNAWISSMKNLGLNHSFFSYLLLSQNGTYLQKNKVKSFPTNIIYNKEGHLIKTKIGEITLDEIKNICGLD